MNAVAGPAKSGFPKISATTLTEAAIPLAVLGIVVALITPMPGFCLDFLLVVDIMLSVIVLMVAMYLVRPADFSVFPTTLLVLTLFRLALNVSSSRLILMNGNSGTSAAGSVIEAFGNFVVGGNYVIGAVIFLILIAIQYVVINHGAVRISEVTARFTLDALPGKQMSIDSDLNAGLIDETQARQRRKDLAAEAEFYGAMDGASRFTQRDAMASLLITGINIIAGFLIGVIQHGMDIKKAIQTYTILTIGDGLVTVIPALMISVAGGMIVTRASSDRRLGVDFRVQVFSKPEPLLLASGVLVALAMFPGLPKIPFLVMGGGLGTLAWRMRKKNAAGGGAAAGTAQAPAAAAAAAKESIEDLLVVEPLSIDVGLGLVRLVDGGADSPLLRRIGAIRRQLATDLGYVLPSVRLKDNLSLRANEYVICMKSVEITRFEIPAGHELAIAVGKPSREIVGEPTREPAFGMPALWIHNSQTEDAKKAGYTVVDPITVMGTHISEFVRRYAHELFSRSDAKKFLDRVSAVQPKMIEDLVPKVLSLPAIQRVLQNLLRERVPIRDAVSIVEAMGEAGATTRNPILITELVRQSIRRTVVKPYLNQAGELPAYFLDASVERRIESGVEHGESSSHINVSPEVVRDLVARVERAMSKPEAPVALVASSGGRYFIRQLIENSIPNLFVVGHNEIPPELKIVSLGII
jgi:flagellar biosynthesis protein FlhA